MAAIQRVSECVCCWQSRKTQKKTTYRECMCCIICMYCAVCEYVPHEHTIHDQIARWLLLQFFFLFLLSSHFYFIFYFSFSLFLCFFASLPPPKTRISEYTFVSSPLAYSRGNIGAINQRVHSKLINAKLISFCCKVQINECTSI